MDRLAIASQIYASMIGRSTRDLSVSSRSPLQATAIRELAEASLSLADSLIEADAKSRVSRPSLTML
jgi:hypothetical protein